MKMADTVVSVSISENSVKGAPAAHPSMIRMGLPYAMPLVPMLLLQNNLNVLQGTYAKHYGLALTTLSAAMMIVGLFDAITDPTVGYWSDRYHARKGTRKPFIVAVEHTGHVLLNVHGGSFMYGSRINSRLEAVPIAALGKIKVISVDYRMAPEHIGLYGASAGPGPDPVSGGGTAIACSPQRL